jgi:hypothetical protein
MRNIHRFISIVLALALSACGGDPSSVGPPAGSFSIGGQVSGLDAGKTLMIANVDGAGQPLQSTSLTANGGYAFTLASGTAYDVRVVGQPLNQICALASTKGIANSDISNINLTCTDIVYKVGGKLSGNGGSVTLRNTSNNDTLALTSDGDFALKPIPAGSAYNIEVIETSVGQGCTVANKSGTAIADVSNILVSCSPVGGIGTSVPPTAPVPPAAPTYTISGTLTGLTSGSIVVKNNGGDALTLTADGGFTFSTRMTSGSNYYVTVDAVPADVQCDVTNPTAFVTGPVTNVMVVCKPSSDASSPIPTFFVGGTVSGVPGGTLATLQLGDGIAADGFQTLQVTNGAFAFPGTYYDHYDYHVSVLQSPSITCTVTHGDGKIQSQNVIDVQVTCVDNGG